MCRKLRICLFGSALLFFLPGAMSCQGQNILPGGHLSGTQLMLEEDVENLRSDMINGICHYFEKALRSSPGFRETYWQRDYSSLEGYSKSIEPNRSRFKKIIGVVDERSPVEELNLVETTSMKSLVAETDRFKIYSVCWPVLDGVTGAGLWVEPRTEPRAQIVVIPDAGQSPEMLMGLTSGISQKMSAGQVSGGLLPASNDPATGALSLISNETESESPVKLKEPGSELLMPKGPGSGASFSKEDISGLSKEIQFARRFAEAGCRLIIPVLINRESVWSGTPGVRMTNQSHREFIYRRAYEVGRHIIGYEVQKVLAAADWFKRMSPELPVGVAGYGEGGLIALYSAAVDCRIDGTLVSGYFQEREDIWQEPLYRNVWGLLTEFGDAEIAGMAAPRLLIIEACKSPEVEGPPKATGEQGDVAAPGRLTTPPLESVQREAEVAEKIFGKLGIADNFEVVISDNGKGPPGTAEAVKKLLTGIGAGTAEKEPEFDLITDRRKDFDPPIRVHDQFNELLAHLDLIIKHSPEERRQFWNKADDSSVEKWIETTKPYREYFRNELIGKMPEPSEPFNPATRLTYETPEWKGYWIRLDVWPEIIAGGILLIPKDIKPGEERPVVVFQHGLGGLPEPLVDPEIESAYHSFGSRLAEQGYIVYAPQNPYGLLIDEPSNRKTFRIVQRMANPLKQSLFSVITGQHDQTLKWLKQLPFVDEERIGFYGLSYGGKTAMRVTPVLKDYSVVICSGDFNEWVWKNTSLHFPASYMFVGEYEIFEFNLANTFNYAEMAGLIAPRPFMVERGHFDGVAPDEWVAYEYAKVRRLYDRLGIGGRTTIEFFNGPHEINGAGTLKFLDKYLKEDEYSGK